jgi:NADH:ubiquinone oxidoreductase subunit D
MHGTVRMVMEVEGEKISSADVQIGYPAPLLREGVGVRDVTRSSRTRITNYISPMLNNVGYALAVEKLMGITQRSGASSSAIVGGLAHHRPHDLPAPAPWNRASTPSSIC